MPLSVIVVVPRLVAPAVLIVTVRLEPEPPSTTPDAGTTAVFDEPADTATAVPSGSVTVKASGPDDTPVPGSTSDWFDGTAPKTGAWLHAHGDPDRGDGAGQHPVGGAIGEAVAAAESAVGRVDERAVGVERQAPLAGPLTSWARERLALGIGVVGQHPRGRDVQRRPRPAW